MMDKRKQIWIKGSDRKRSFFIILSVFIMLVTGQIDISAENKAVTISLGEGHEALAGRFIECINEDQKLVFAEREDEESSDVVLNIQSSDIEAKDIIELSNETLNKILDENKTDNDQIFCAIVLKGREDIEGIKVNDGDVYCVLWKEENETKTMQRDKGNDEEDGGYRIVKGHDNLNWLKRSKEGLEFYFSDSEDEQAVSQDLDHISVDSDTALDEEDYTVQGSLYIRLTASYLNTLDEGNHILKVSFTDGKDTISNFNVRSIESSDLPVVVINITEGSIEEMNDDQEHKTGCSGTLDIRFPENYSYIEKPGFVKKDLLGLTIEEFRGRGNSSWRMPKKPYKIKLEKKADLFSMGENKHWVLLANYLDKTLLKDRIIADLSSQMSFDFTPECVNVEVYMNDVINGKQYCLGNYMLAEQVRLGKNRLDINELEEDDIDEKEITGGYLIQGGQQRFLSPDFFRTEHSLLLANDTPSFDTNDGDNDNKVQMDYIRGHIQKVEDALYADDFTGADGISYKEYLDIDSAVDYFLINEVMVNEDAYETGSHYFYKVSDTFNEDGSLKEIGKIYYGPIWDFDKCLGEDKSDSIYGDEERYRMLEGFSLQDAWFKAMLRDPQFLSRVNEKWIILKQLLTSMNSDGGLIDRLYAENRKSQADDYAYWFEGKKNVYEEEINDLKNRIAYRIAYIDEHIADLDDAIHKVDFIVDGQLDIRRYCRRKDYVDLYDLQKEGYIFLGWLDEKGVIIEEVDDTSYDRTFTASFVSKEEATKANEIIFLMDDVYGEPGNRNWARYTLFPEDAQDKSIVWSSSDDEVVTVDEKGTIVMNKEGEAIITATLASGVRGSYNVKVINDRPVYETFEIPDTLYISQGEHARIEIRIYPEEADFGYFAFNSESDEVATVDSNGVVKGIRPGQTYVNVEADCYDPIKQKDIRVEKRCRVIVLEEGIYECINVSGKEWEKGNKNGMIFVFKRSRNEDMTFDLFNRLSIDGKDVNEDAYVKTKGSIIIRLKASYLDTLQTGRHVLKVDFLDSKQNISEFVIKEKRSPGYIIPVTGIE